MTQPSNSIYISLLLVWKTDDGTKSNQTEILAHEWFYEKMGTYLEQFLSQMIELFKWGLHRDTTVCERGLNDWTLEN